MQKQVIISGLSSEWVLSDGGFLHYAYALGFGAHLGNPRKANLGDGRGWVNQTIELRNDFGNDIIGTCWESLVGGNHFRMWRQSTTKALFLAYVNRMRLFVFLWALTCVCTVWIVFPRKR